MSTSGGRSTGLRRVSPLVLGSPTKIDSPVGRPIDIDRQLRRLCRPEEGEVTPDSEEERVEARTGAPPPRSTGSPVKAATRSTLTVIEISSSESEPDVVVFPNKTKAAPVEDPFLSSLTKSKPAPFIQIRKLTDDNEIEDDSDEGHLHLPKSTTKGKSHWTRRTIISDSEESAGESEKEQVVGGDSVEDDNDAILVLDDPRSARKPLVRPSASPIKPFAKNGFPSINTDIQSTPSGGRELVADRTPLETPVLPRASGGRRALTDYFPPTPVSPTKNKQKVKDASVDSTASMSVRSVAPAATSTPASNSPTKKGGRVSKKAQEEAKQAHLAAYTQALFAELNDSVFGKGLPEETALIWNKRLQTTAGKAKWHSSKTTGKETTSIELAPKVLDCEERIRNTLSHEMCHLAVWVISRNPKESHGPIWTAWAKKVAEKRPDIHITLKHSYDIAYKYEWKCQNVTCNKIYGRHSKSIDHVNSICGVCKTGDLLPLFQTRARKPKLKADSPMAAETTRDSPTTIDRLLARRPAAGTPSQLRKWSDASDVTNASGVETEPELELDTDDVVEVELPTSSIVTIRRSDTSTLKNPTKTPGNGAVDRELGGLVKHLSIIDLTED